MKTEYIVLKETVLNNNCPECYSKESLLLSFKQKKTFSKLFIKTNKEVIESMDCRKCETTIFPGRWTDDIERVYNYHRKTIDLKSSSVKFTGLFYLIVFLVIALSATLGIFIIHPELFQIQ
ncbi:hypothetical protein SAMN04487910_1446 [Aquimarina amphilecti]|uniref:Uncharacterized protein n=1 Tax=Aquimarina amphilecti TaxID=1038014 RepID=A0A1H7KVV2_AQUAM|nr:hypothetical protein [Aquimarina amphilecti]SEK90888.1 hypothetical protein SAMN04487910_1446 [Aquimarina amphilecti]